MIGRTHRKLDLPPEQVQHQAVSEDDVKPAEPRQEINVNGVVDRANPDISFIGKATLMSNGMWRCLANVGGMMCLVECKGRPRGGRCMFEAYHVLITLPGGGVSPVLDERIRALRVGSKSHRMSCGSIVYYVGEATEAELEEAGSRILAEEREDGESSE